MRRSRCAGSNLLQLSSLAREGLQDFRRAWGGITRARRREILALLVELSEDNLELDFSGVFRSCLSDKCEVVARTGDARAVGDG